MPEPKMYTEEEVQRLVNQQRTVTTWENMMERLGQQMSQAEYNLCESFRRAMMGAPPPGQAAPGGPDQKEPDGGDHYPDA